MRLLAGIPCNVFLAAGLRDLPRLYVGLALLLLLIIALGLFVWYYRRWMFSEPEQGGESWSLSDLRSLRDSGQITPAEYERMRAALLGNAAGLLAGSDGPETPCDGDFEVQKRPPDGR